MTAPTDHDDPPPAEAPPPEDYPEPIPLRGRATQRAGDVDEALRAAERSTLGGMMLDKRAIDEVTAVIYNPGDFLEPAHETIFRVILDLTGRGHPVEAVTVGDQLAEQGDLTRVGGAPYLHRLISETPSWVNAGYYATIVRDRSVRRQLLAAGTRISELADAAEIGSVDAVVLAASAQLQHVLDLHADGTIGAPSSWDPVDTTHLDLDVMTEPALLARTDGRFLLYEGTVHAFVGESESGKTWLALEAIRQCLLDEQHAVMFDFEDRAQRVVRRLVELGVPRPLVDANFRYVRPDTALTAGEYPRLERAAKGCALAVIDGVTEAMTMHGLSLTNNEDVAKFLGLLPRRIANVGPAVVQIDHVVKDEEKRGRYAVGGEHKLAGLDGAQYKVQMIKPFAKGKRGEANILIDKDREGSVRELAQGIKAGVLVIDSTPGPGETRGTLRLSIEPPDEHERTESGEFRPTQIMKKISEHLWLIPDLTGRQIEEALPHRAQHVRQALKALVDEGYVEAKPGARNSRLHSTIMPFDE